MVPSETLINTPLRMGRVVRCGKSFTAKETASLNTSLLTSHFTAHPLPLPGRTFRSLILTQQPAIQSQNRYWSKDLFK